MPFLQSLTKIIPRKRKPNRKLRTALEQDSPLTQSPSIDSIHSSQLSNPSELPQLPGSRQSSLTIDSSATSSHTELPLLPVSVRSIGSTYSQSSSDQLEAPAPRVSLHSSVVSIDSFHTAYSTMSDTGSRPPSPAPMTRMPLNRGRFPALPPNWVSRRTPSPEPEALVTTPGSDALPLDAGPSAQSHTGPRQPRKRSDSISPPRGYVPPPRDHPPPPPTLQIPEPPAGLEERQAIIDGYIKSLAQKRNDSNFPARTLVEAAETMTRQLRSQREWLNPNARLTMSLPSWFVIETADAQDHLLRRMRYTGWVNRSPGDLPQQWMQGVLVGGPGNAARAEALRRREVVSPFEFFGEGSEPI